MKLVLIGRLSRNSIMRDNKIVEKSEFRLLQRKSNGVLSDLIGDEEYDVPNMNLSSFEPGLYQLTTTNHSHDWETNVLDGFDITLTPFTEAIES